MLMRNFLTPAELNISDQQFEALLKVLGMLERGELIWHSAVGRGDKLKTMRFNMNNWPVVHCGSVGCIGFWAEKIGKVSFDVFDLTAELDDLFYNDIATINVNTKPEEAAQALQNYLTTGKADWADVLTHKG